MISDYVRLAYTSLKSRKLRSWLTMLGVFIGIAAVVSLVSLGEGLRTVVSTQFDILAPDVLTIRAEGAVSNGPPGEGVVNPLKTYYADDLRSIRGVQYVLPRIIERTTLTFNGVADFTFAGSMLEGKERQELLRVSQFELASGRMLKDGDRRKVVLGSNYARPDRFGKEVRLRDTVLVEDVRFEVVGFLKKKGSFIVDNMVIMQEEDIKTLFSVNETLDLIVVTVDSLDLMDNVQENIESYLRDERDVKEGEEDFTVESPEKSMEQLNSLLFAVQLFVYVIAAVSLVIGGIGIANTMYTAVLERTREIGIMKAIGASNKSIFFLFFLEAGFIGLVGGVVGTLAGVGLGYGLSLAGSLALGTSLIKAQPNLLLLVGALLFSFVIGVASGILPAWQASKLRPVDALRSTK